MRRIILTLSLALLSTQAALAGYDEATFTDTGLISGVGQYSNNSGGFTSGGQYFNNTYSPAYGGYWNGFAVSSMTDTATPGYTNQYSAITGAATATRTMRSSTPRPTSTSRAWPSRSS